MSNQSNSIRSKKEILNKLKIGQLNPMQEQAQLAIESCNEIILLSPTGTGKTLAFLLPIIAELQENCDEVQTLIIVPSRELAIQIEQVIREMGTGYRTFAVYGGRSFSNDLRDLKTLPAVLIGTPGRIADHLRRSTFSTEDIKTLILDEFDKSLEIGFEEQMEEIIETLSNIKKRILTSATDGVSIPNFIQLKNPTTIDYLDEKLDQLKIKSIISPNKDKLPTLVDALCHLGNQPGIIFCNYKDSIQRISDFLTENKIDHGCFFGGMEQKDRERALIKFRNGTHQLLLATDLAARGIDVPEIKFIIHFHLPNREEDFTHRNGRTARMQREGTAFVLEYEEDKLPEFIEDYEVELLNPAPIPKPSNWQTLFISGGKKDKISKGDIAGLFFKVGQLNKDELGVIELKFDCAFVAVKTSKTQQMIDKLNNTKLKKKKVRVYLV